MKTLIALLSAVEPQHWLVFGLVLLIAEMATGTTYLLWPALAAFLTGGAAFLGLRDWGAELALFAALVIVLTFFGRPLVQNWRKAGAANGLNERAAAMVGARGVVASFADGAGSVKINDTVWRVVSEEALAAGEHVEIAAVDGVTLTVKRIG